MAPARFLPFILVVLAAIVCAVVGDGAPPVNQWIGHHTRFVRRNFHQPPGDDQELIPIRHKAPPPAFMHNEDLIRFVQCYYDPSIADCDETNEEYEAKITKVTPHPNIAWHELSSGEVVDVFANQPAVEELIRPSEGDQDDDDDDDYSSMIDDSIFEYINKHLDPKTD